MKKIILGCAAVLLSLGLLAGCNNEESDKAVSIKVDTAATVVVGESLSLPYTVEPEKADIEVLNDHEEYVTAVAQEGTLYLEGIAEGSATVTLVGTYKKYTEANVSIAVSVVTEATADTGPEEEEPGDTGDTGPGEQVITLSVDATLDLIENGEPATIVPDVTPAEAEIEYEIKDVEFVVTDPEPDEDAYVINVTPTEEGYVVTPSLQGTANIVFTASLEEEGYDAVTATTAVTVHEAGWEPEPEPEPEPESLTYVITLGSLEAAPEDTVLYAAGDFNGTWNAGEGDGGWYDWGEPVELVSNEDATYNLELDFLPENGRSFEIIATNPTYDNNATDDRWNHVIGSYTITGITDASNGTTIEIEIETDFDSWEDGDNPVFKALGEDETIYVVFLDDGKEAEKVSADNMNVGTYTVVDNKGNATFGASKENSCTPTMTTTTNSSRVAFYTEEVTVPANAVVEFDLSVTVSEYTHHLTSPDLTVPETEEGKINVLVLGSPFNGWLSDTTYLWWSCSDDSGDYAGSGLGWQTMESASTISDFVNSITYTNPWEEQ